MKNLSKYEQGFIEGFLDTDGSIFVCKTERKTKYRRKWVIRVYVTFVNNSKDLLEKVKNILGLEQKNILIGQKATIMKAPTNSKEYHTKDTFRLSLSHSEIRELLPQIELVLKEKKRQKALVILDYLSKYDYKRKNDTNYNLQRDKNLLEHVNDFKNIKENETISSVLVNKPKLYNDFSDRERGFLDSAIDCDGSIYITKVNNKNNGSFRPILTFYGRPRLLNKIRNILGTNIKLVKNYRDSVHRLVLRGETRNRVLSSTRLIIKEHKRKIALDMGLFQAENKSYPSIDYYNKLNELYKSFYK